MRHLPNAERVHLCRNFVAKRFVWSIFIELGDERVEAPLLLSKIGRRRHCSFFLQRSMHALVAAVLIRRTATNEVRQNSQLHQSHAQRGLPRQTHSSKRHSVIRSHRDGQAVLAEADDELAPCGLRRWMQQSLATNDEARIVVRYRQRIDEPSVTGSELPLEVDRPRVIRSHGVDAWSSHIRWATTAVALRFHEAVSIEDAVDRARRRPLLIGVPPLERGANL